MTCSQRKKLKTLIIFISLIYSIGLQAIDVKDENKILNNKIKDMEVRLNLIETNYEKEQKELKNLLIKTEKNKNILEKKLLVTESKLNKATDSLTKISLIWSKSSNASKLGAFILLCGLLIEIIGATVLTGNHLIAKQKDVFTLKSTPPSVDLSLNDVNTEPKINFLGSLASILLFLGFVLQFTGTILVFSLPTWLNVFMVLLSIIPAFLILYYLLGQSYNQSRVDKIKIVFRNFRRNFIPEFGLKCDFCTKKVNKENAKIWWLQEPNSENYPFLYQPHYMHIGHEECLSKNDTYKPDPTRNIELPEINIIKVSVQEFIDNRIPELRKWWIEYNNSWAEKRHLDTNDITDAEYQFEELVKRIEK